MSAWGDSRPQPPMSEVPFYKTRMGQVYYELTMPELVEQLERLNELLVRVVELAGPGTDNHPNEPGE